MKYLFKLLCIGLLFITSSAFADTYEGSMTGIACSGCKKKIAVAVGKIDGVVEVRVAKKEKDGQHKLTVVTNGKVELTEAQVKKAVAVAEHYKMTKWSKVKPKAESKADS